MCRISSYQFPSYGNRSTFFHCCTFGKVHAVPTMIPATRMDALRIRSARLEAFVFATFGSQSPLDGCFVRSWVVYETAMGPPHTRVSSLVQSCVRRSRVTIHHHWVVGSRCVPPWRKTAAGIVLGRYLRGRSDPMPSHPIIPLERRETMGFDLGHAKGGETTDGSSTQIREYPQLKVEDVHLCAIT